MSICGRLGSMPVRLPVRPSSASGGYPKISAMGDEMTLYEGDIDSTTSGWVTTLQLALERAGFGPEGGVDGKFGWRTKAAVVAFQQAQGFADHGGTVGNQTWAALMGRDPEPAGTNNAAHGGLYHQHPEADHVPEVRPDSLMMEDPSVWVGAAVDYHNDPELASIIADVDSAFPRRRAGMGRPSRPHCRRDRTTRSGLASGSTS